MRDTPRRKGRRKSARFAEPREGILPPSLYMDIAPLPVPFAEYQLDRYLKQFPSAPPNQILEEFLNAVSEKRETAFEVMDDFVLNRFEPVSPEFRLSTYWFQNALASYDPMKTMPDSTFKNWQQRGIIRMEGHGKPKPSNAAAVFMIRIFDRQKENIFPETLRASEPDYWCGVVETPDSPPEVIPINQLGLLPPGAIVWTPWAGAVWEKDRWHLVGENGAIRFAGTRLVRGKLWWNVDLATLQTWDKKAVTLYKPVPGNHERQVQDIANVVLDRLFVEKVPQWNKQTKKISHRVTSLLEREKGEKRT